MRLTRRNNSETDPTSTRREVKRLLLLLLGVAAVVSVGWFALNVIASVAGGSGGGPREAILRAVGFGSVLIVGWVGALIFALAFRRDWLSRYNLWLGSAALIIAAIGALSFLSPSEGLLGWFALGGQITPGGWLGETIIGSNQDGGNALPCPRRGRPGRRLADNHSRSRSGDVQRPGRIQRRP